MVPPPNFGRVWQQHLNKVGWPDSDTYAIGELSLKVRKKYNSDFRFQLYCCQEKIGVKDKSVIFVSIFTGDTKVSFFFQRFSEMRGYY